MALQGRTSSFHAMSTLSEEESLLRNGDNEFSITYTEPDAQAAVRGLAKKRSGKYWIEERPILTQF